MKEQPINALVMDKEKPPAPVLTLSERIEALEDRLDHVERELALLTGRDQGEGLLSRIGPGVTPGRAWKPPQSTFSGKVR